MSGKQSSPNWKLIQQSAAESSLKDRVDAAIGNTNSKFPYHEGFPRTPYDIEGARFGLVIPLNSWRGVEEVEAIVDYSTQYRAEGLQWRLTGGSSEFRPNTAIDQYLVIAWYEK
jgi:hypothetical protein